MKRLEALKQERQKRIAARSGSSNTKPTSTPQQNRALLPAKVSPSSYKGSKFSDSEPTSTSPVPKVRTPSLGSNGFLTTTKVSRLNRGTPSAENELSRSASSLPDLSKESKIVATASIQTKRLSDPKGIRTRSSIKSTSSDKLPRQIVSGEPQKKIPAVMHQDKTRSATSLAPKIRSQTGPSDTLQSKASKRTGSKNSLTSESHQMKRTNEKSSRMSNGDESAVVDKTIVMLENDTNFSSSITPTVADMITPRGGSFVEDGEKIEIVPDYVAIHAPPSPLLTGEIEDPNKHEVVTDYVKDEPPKLLNSDMTEKTYQAPYARATSLEDPTTSNLEYKEQPSIVNNETILMTSESIKAHVPDWPDSTTKEQIHDAFEKPRSRESSKGFRKLFKFGKKNQGSTSGDYNLEPECASHEDSTGSAVSTEVHSLKNLISQDDAHNGGSPHKVSRPFSILFSPFRAKTQEKKVAA
ncbi:hypothetical protein J5N97_001457 [Dioscorea zingiberensis]|uniref:Uncharacterized protein n=1 Tax=Dioscorea zingiberensis TaxID=325984 RepID=A0A9D5BU05_9LILI|nr:hypothetical protein J5N97_001457 [Dioscorea zingiberensis]